MTAQPMTEAHARALLEALAPTLEDAAYVRRTLARLPEVGGWSKRRAVEDLQARALCDRVGFLTRAGRALAYRVGYALSAGHALPALPTVEA